jgi:hypothetical protein
VEITQTISGNTITIDFLRPNATGTAYVYFFSIFPQTKPDYGLAVWDASGTLILTNETRTLSDVVTLGTAGVDASSGYNINTTLAGKWACMPAMLGLITGVISAGGQPSPTRRYTRAWRNLRRQHANIRQTTNNAQRKPSERRVFESEKRDYGHQLRQLRLIVFGDQLCVIDLQNQLYPFDSSCYCLASLIPWI